MNITNFPAFNDAAKARVLLPSVVQEGLAGVFSRYPQVVVAVLYGSRAKGCARNGSDIDLTLFGASDNGELNIALLNQISNEIDDLLLPYHVDLSVFSHIKNNSLIDHIYRVGVAFYVKETN